MFDASRHNWVVIGVSSVALIATPLAVSPVASAEQINETQINAQICSGGSRTGSYDITQPANNQTLASPNTTIVGQAHWLRTISVTRDNSTLGTFNASNTSDEAANIIIPLLEGPNHLTITSTGGCPEVTSTQNLTLNYLPAAATMPQTFTNNSSPRLTGSVGNPNVRVFIEINSSTYEATNNSDGTWTLPAGTIHPLLADGTYDVRIYTTEGSNPARLADTTVSHGLIIDTVPPKIDATTTHATLRSPALHGTVDDPMADIIITINDTTYHVQNNGDGTWTLPAGTIKPHLASGQYPITLQATDRAGNTTRYKFILHIDAPHELVFILPPNTGYLRIGSVNIPSITLYLGVGLLLIAACLWQIRKHSIATKTTAKS